MTLNEPGLLPTHETPSFAPAHVAPPTLHQSAGIFPPKTIETAADDPLRLFDVRDVREAFEMLNPNRTNTRYADNAVDDPGFGCRYSRRHPATLELDRALPLPDCLVGSLLALLCPTYYLDVAQDATLGVASLPAIYDVFTPQAVQLLHAMQRFADGVSGTPMAWGDAWNSATIQLLDTQDI